MDDRSAILTGLVIRYQYQRDPHIAGEVVLALAPYITRQASDLEERSFGMANRADLVGTGNEECLRCIEKYKVDSGPFLQYAIKAIRGAMLHYLRDKTIDVKISGSIKETMYAIQRFIRDFKKRNNGVEPSLSQICTGMNYSVARVEEAMSISAYVRLSKNIDDCEGKAIAWLDGSTEDSDLMSGEDAKKLVKEVVEMRKRGAGVQEFMLDYGLAEEQAKELVELVDLYFMDQVAVPEGEDLLSFIAGLL